MKIIKNTYLTALLILLSPMAANADHIVSGYIDGTITYVGGDDLYSVGESIRVDFSYDLDAAPTCDPWSSGCAYSGLDWLSNTVTIGSDVYDPLDFGDEVNGRISVSNSGSFVMTSWSGDNQSSPFYGLRVGFFDNAITGMGLPTHLDADDIGTGGYGNGILELNSDELLIWFDATAVYAREVPEPGTLALLGLGLAGIGFARRKRA